MKTGLSKKQKATNIYFTEADTMIEVCTSIPHSKTGSPTMPGTIPPSAD